jgi:hypothetical protein
MLLLEFETNSVIVLCVIVTMLNVVAHVVAAICFRSGTESESRERRRNDLPSWVYSCHPLTALLVELALSPAPRTHFSCEIKIFSYSIPLLDPSRMTCVRECPPTGCLQTLAFVPMDQARLLPPSRRTCPRDNLEASLSDIPLPLLRGCNIVYIEVL